VCVKSAPVDVRLSDDHRSCYIVEIVLRKQLNKSRANLRIRFEIPLPAAARHSAIIQSYTSKALTARSEADGPDQCKLYQEAA
jgi:hypothetical protein